MIRPTLNRIATWRRRERLAVEMTAMGAPTVRAEELKETKHALA